MADDDPDDCLMAKEAMEESRLSNDVRFVSDGEELMDYLHHRGNFADMGSSPAPGLILLDLNMPRKDGRTALAEIKSHRNGTEARKGIGAYLALAPHPSLRGIPVVVLTTSRAEEDILRTYDLGVSSYIPKPVTFEGLVDVMMTLKKYWFEIVELPPQGH